MRLNVYCLVRQQPRKTQSMFCLFFPISILEDFAQTATFIVRKQSFIFLLPLYSCITRSQFTSIFNLFMVFLILPNSMLVFLVSLFSFTFFLFLNGFKLEKSNFTNWFLIKEMIFWSKVREIEEKEEESVCNLLDLPELALDIILDKLSPAELCAMAGVCSSLREKCGGDHFWDQHLRRKWGEIIGNAAFKEWQLNFASKRRNPELSSWKKQRGLIGFLLRKNSPEKRGCKRPVDFVMAWYLSLETGELWFAAQVYNRENGHSGFMLSCYDAKLKYNNKTNTFQARYAAQGRAIEENITWDRVRAAPVETPSNELHISDCLHDLKPGDHIEIQWRRSKEFSYGWWYGVVGHLESCHGNENLCQCKINEMVVLEFRQYPTRSQWRITMINRKDHREVGNEADGFYGGIRKLYKEEEIAMWKRLWPKK